MGHQFGMLRVPAVPYVVGSYFADKMQYHYSRQYLCRREQCAALGTSLKLFDAILWLEEDGEVVLQAVACSYLACREPRMVQ
jgi:hypothetical protein